MKEKESGTEVSMDYREAYREINGVKKESDPPKNEDPTPEETDTELDDFLPDDEEDQEEELLTKFPMEHLDADAIAVTVKRKRKRRYSMAVGAVVLALALVGVCFLVGTVGHKVYEMVTDDSDLRAYDTFLAPIVMQDPEPFEDSSTADEGMIQMASLWRAVTVNAAEYTEYDESGRTIVPLADVVDACHALFGPECELQPKSVKDETFFEFDVEKNVYYVVPYSTQGSFAPYTVSKKTVGVTTVLKVGYVSAADEWRDDMASSAAESPTPVKYMEYVLKADLETGQEYVTAIRSATE